MRRLLAPAIARAHGFTRDDRGVTMVEFAILALPFFTIILAILQTALVFLAQQVLDSALEDASRLVRTGQAGSGTTYASTADLRSYMCGYTFGLMNCDDILLKVEKIDSFDDVELNPVVQDCTNKDPSKPLCKWVPATPPYETGSKRTIEQVSAYYRYPLVIVLPYFNIKNQPDNYRLISAIRVFRNEPFGG
jgi:Flp pilus assembly protein TadG